MSLAYGQLENTESGNNGNGKRERNYHVAAYTRLHLSVQLQAMDSYLVQVEKNFLKKIKGSRTEWVNLTHLKVKKQDSYVICGANEACNVSTVFRVLHACIL